MTDSSAKWLTLTEASSLLGCTRQRVHQLVSEGTLRGQCVSTVGGRRQWMVDPEAVETRLAELRARPPRCQPTVDFAALPSWLSLGEVSRALGLTMGRVSALVREQRLRAARHNRRRWLRRADLQAFVLQRELERTRKSERGRPPPDDA